MQLCLLLSTRSSVHSNDRVMASFDVCASCWRPSAQVGGLTVMKNRQRGQMFGWQREYDYVPGNCLFDTVKVVGQLNLTVKDMRRMAVQKLRDWCLDPPTSPECSDLEVLLIQLMKDDYGPGAHKRMNEPHSHPEWVQTLDDYFSGMETCATENSQMALWGDGYVVMALAYALNLRIEVYMPAMSFMKAELSGGAFRMRCPIQ